MLVHRITGRIHQRSCVDELYHKSVAEHDTGLVTPPEHTCQISMPLAFSFKASVESPPCTFALECHTRLQYDIKSSVYGLRVHHR